MEGISDIKIIGIDETRPPRIRKEPYIDIFFKLSHQAPSDWCKDFNNLFHKQTATVQIKENEGQFIETWVRHPDEIVPLFELIKEALQECTRQYIERIEISARQNNDSETSSKQVSGEQARLNKIIASLEFDEITD